MVEYYKDIDKKRSNLFKDDFSNGGLLKYEAKTKNDGWNVEIDREFNVLNNSSSAELKIDTKFKDLKDLKVEAGLSEDNMS